MTNIHEIEKEIIQLQENIEAALNELQTKPRGIMAKYAKLTRFEDGKFNFNLHFFIFFSSNFSFILKISIEILGPNKDLTNIDTEIKEAEEFLSEDQINIIRSIVTTDETNTLTEGATSSSKCSSTDKIEADSSKWENLRPTLRSLGLVRESLSVSGPNLNASTEEDSDFDSLSDDDSDMNDEFEDDGEEDTHEEDNEDHDNDIDLESIQKRRKRFRQKLKFKRKKKLLLRQTNENDSNKVQKQDDLEIITLESEPVIIVDEVKVAPKIDSSATEDLKTSLNKQDVKTISNESDNQTSRQRSSASLSKSIGPTESESEKKAGKFLKNIS